MREDGKKLQMREIQMHPATGVPVFKSLVWLDPEKSRRKRDANPGSSALEADALTTRPARRYYVGHG